MTVQKAWLRTLVASVALLLLAQPRVSADSNDKRDEARLHFASGEKLYREGDFRGAIAEFQAAEALAPSPILAFNLGLCREKLGEAAAAVTLFRDYLARRPDAPNRAQVEAKIARLEAPPPAPAAEPALEPAPVVEPAPTPTPVPGLVPAPTAEPVPAPVPAAEPSPNPTVVDAYAARPLPAPAPPSPAPAPMIPERPKETPVYKQWWFWVVVGVSAYIVVDIATTDNAGGNHGAVPVLLRF